MVDLKLKNDTHDLEFKDFDLVIATTDNELIQRIKIKLQFFFAEWFLDTTKGIQFYENIYKKRPNINTVDNIFKRTILEEPEFNSLIEYQTTFDLQKREYFITFIVKKNDGSILNFSGNIIL